MPRLVDLWVPGVPRPQGSMKMLTTADGRAFGKYSDRTVDHRNAMIGWLVQKGCAVRHQGPVEVTCAFLFPRPKAHYGTGKNAARVRPSAPTRHTQTPDVDKLLRLVNDALTIAGVLEDDSQVVRLVGGKAWATLELGPGTAIRVETLDEDGGR